MTQNPVGGAAGDAVASGPKREDPGSCLPGLLLALILAMLDQTVVSTALPRIVRRPWAGVTHLSWVVTSYVLASTVDHAALWQSFGDLYGRKRWAG